jgi:hypothetical protein
MVDGKVQHGVLERLAGKAAALTAILGLVFLLAPNLRPRDTPDDVPPSLGIPKSVVSRPASVALSAKEAIRSILAADHQAGLSAFKAEREAISANDEPGVLRTQGERVAYWLELQRRASAAATAYNTLLATMRGLPLSSTSDAFQTSYQSHISAWQEKANVYNQWVSLVDTTSLNVLAYGEAAYPQTAFSFFEQAKLLTAQLLDADRDVNRTWDEVRRASLAAGIDAPE